MNLSMLQMTIQSLEMQRTTVSTVQAMSKMATDTARSMAAGTGEAPATPETNAFSEAAMWPWQMMQQMREQMQQSAEAAAAAVSETSTAAPAGKASGRSRK
jgi:hypothetical protein